MGYFALDIETSPVNPADSGFAALEPWRVRNGSAFIMSVDLIDPEQRHTQIVNTEPKQFKQQVKQLLQSLKGEVVWAHHAIFDIAWLVGLLQPQRCGSIPQEIVDIDWRDTSLLMKWLVNGQKAEQIRFSFSLANLVKVFLPEHPNAAAFVEMKEAGFAAGQNTQYWLERAHWDVQMTQALALKYTSRLPVEQRKGFLTEQGCLVPVANSWINGIRVDTRKLELAEDFYALAKSRIAKELSVSPGLFTSPKQLGAYLFGTLGLKPVSMTPSGNPGTSKEDLVWLQHGLLQTKDPRAKVIAKIMEAKQSSTLFSKYVKTTYEALQHNGDGFIYASPRLFGTYTGRMTYSNATMKKYKTGLAFHQIPRQAELIRDFLCPPEGFALYEADASGQESRLMALRSNDPVMIDIFKRELNFHSMTGAGIITMDYDEFEAHRAAENGSGIYTEYRQRGKLGNLSCNYRISGKALANQSFVKYGEYLDEQTGRHIVNTFQRTYKGVPKYWDEVIDASRKAGFTEEFGGRRFKLNRWSSDQWLTESSAISFPIQGAGASMKEIAIAELHKKVHDFHMTLDLHDATFAYMPIDKLEEMKAQMDEVLNNIDYEPYWGFKPEIKLPYESMQGQSFADVK